MRLIAPKVNRESMTFGKPEMAFCIEADLRGSKSNGNIGPRGGHSAVGMASVDARSADITVRLRNSIVTAIEQQVRRGVGDKCPKS